MYLILSILVSGISNLRTLEPNGQRLKDFEYHLYNWNADAYETKKNNGFVALGRWTDISGWEDCTDLMRTVAHCGVAHFNTKDNMFPASNGPYADKALPEVLKIAGYFNSFNADGGINKAGAQNLAAFVMAIREINNKTDGIADDLLPKSCSAVRYKWC